MTDPEERPFKIRKLEPETLEVPSDENNDFRAESENKPTLSKSQLKKLRKSEQWAAGKEYRKSKRREKHKEKQARKAEERDELQAKIAAGEIVPEPPKPVETKLRFRRPIQVPVALILDCDFNELMSEKELISLGAQLTRCYSDNKTNPYRSHIAISSWGGKLQERFETVLTNNHKGWKGVRFFEGDFEIAAQVLDEAMKGPGGGKLVGALAPDSEDAKQAEAKSADFKSTKKTETSNEPRELKAAVDVSLKPLGHLPKQEGTAASDGTTFFSTSSIAIPPSSTKTAEEAPNPTSNIPPSGLVTQPPPETTTSEKPSIVYLTSDSPYTLEHLSPNTSYIIGGIVDKNRYKGLCYKRARERGIATAKLPIGEYMTMQSRTVLTINHVVEIMLKWLETGNWGEAFLTVIPKRKEAKLKRKAGEEESASPANDGSGDEYKDDDEEGDTPVLENESAEKMDINVEIAVEKDELPFLE